MFLLKLLVSKVRFPTSSSTILRHKELNSLDYLTSCKFDHKSGAVEQRGYIKYSNVSKAAVTM